MGTSLYDRYVAETQGAPPAGAPPPSLYDQYQASGPSAPSKADLVQRAKVRQRQNANDRDQADAETPGYGTQVLGGIASLVKDIPGAEAAQAGARALVRGQSYRDALRDIQGAEADAPSGVRNFNRIAGGAVGASVVPGSPAVAGARYGFLSGLGHSDPDADARSRVHAGYLRAAIGGAAGGLANAGITAVRAAFAPSSGSASLARTAAIKEADQAAYGQAAKEGAQPQPMPPAVHEAFNEPDIAPYVDVVRKSRSFANADEPTILREAYKQMSERQGTLANRAGNATDFKAGTTLEKADVGLAKQQMLDAADPVMPSFRPAVEQHAEMAGNRGAFRTVADAADRAIRGTPVAAKKLDKQSQEAVIEAIRKMKEEAASAGLEGALGRVKDSYHASFNPLKLLNLPNASRASPYVNALDQQTGTAASAFWPALRNGLVGSGTSALGNVLHRAGLE